MVVKSSAIVIGNMLLCAVPNADWHFFIRRLDGENDVAFSTFHRKEFGAADVAKFIPNWKTLHWTKIKDSQLGHSESYIKDAEFEINVYAPMNSTKKHPEVVEAFLAFMHGI
jgi:hypothetical protein